MVSMYFIIVNFNLVYNNNVVNIFQYFLFILHIDSISKWVNDMIEIPDDVWEPEKNYTRLSDVDQLVLVPRQACLSIKVIYNNDWVRDAGGGYKVYHQRAIEVVNEAEKIFNTKFASANRLATAIAFILVGGIP